MFEAAPHAVSGMKTVQTVFWGKIIFHPFPLSLSNPVQERGVWRSGAPFVFDEGQLTQRKIKKDIHNFHCWIPGTALDSGNSRWEITSRKVFFFFSFLTSPSERGPENTYGFVELGSSSEEPSHKHSHTRALVFYVHTYTCDCICQGLICLWLQMFLKEWLCFLFLFL